MDGLLSAICLIKPFYSVIYKGCQASAGEASSRIGRVPGPGPDHRHKYSPEMEQRSNRTVWKHVSLQNQTDPSQGLFLPKALHSGSLCGLAPTHPLSNNTALSIPSFKTVHFTLRNTKEMDTKMKACIKEYTHSVSHDLGYSVSCHRP